MPLPPPPGYKHDKIPPPPGYNEAKIPPPPGYQSEQKQTPIPEGVGDMSLYQTFNQAASNRSFDRNDKTLDTLITGESLSDRYIREMPIREVKVLQRITELEDKNNGGMKPLSLPEIDEYRTLQNELAFINKTKESYKPGVARGVYEGIVQDSGTGSLLKPEGDNFQKAVEEKARQIIAEKQKDNTAYNIGRTAGQIVGDVAPAMASVPLGPAGIAAASTLGAGRRNINEQERIAIQQGKQASDADYTKAALYTVPEAAFDTAANFIPGLNVAGGAIAKGAGKVGDLAIATGMGVAGDILPKMVGGDRNVTDLGYATVFNALLQGGLRGSGKLVDVSGNKFAKAKVTKALTKQQELYVADNAAKLVELSGGSNTNTADLSAAMKVIADATDNQNLKLKAEAASKLAIKKGEIGTPGLENKIANEFASTMLGNYNTIKKLYDVDGKPISQVFNKGDKDGSWQIASALKTVAKNEGVEITPLRELASQYVAKKAIGMTDQQAISRLQTYMKRKKMAIDLQSPEFMNAVNEMTKTAAMTSKRQYLIDAGKHTDLVMNEVRDLQMQGKTFKDALKESYNKFRTLLVDDEAAAKDLLLGSRSLRAFNTEKQKIIKEISSIDKSSPDYKERIATLNKSIDDIDKKITSNIGNAGEAAKFRGRLAKSESTAAEQAYMQYRRLSATRKASEAEYKNHEYYIRKSRDGSFLTKEELDNAGLINTITRADEINRAKSQLSKEFDEKISKIIEKETVDGVLSDYGKEKIADVLKAKKEYSAESKITFGGLNETEIGHVRSIFDMPFSEFKKYAQSFYYNIKSPMLKNAIIKMANDESAFNHAVEASNKVFEINQLKLKEMLDSGYISDKDYANLSKYKYARREFLGDKDKGYRHLSDEFDELDVNRLKNIEGSSDVVDTNILRQLKKTIESNNEQIAKQKVNNLVLKSAIDGDGIFHIKEGVGKIPDGYVEKTITSNGTDYKVIFPKGAEYIFKKADHRDIIGALNLITGTSVLKKFATVMNLDFAAANIFRDIFYHVFRDSAGIYAPKVAGIKVPSQMLGMALFAKDAASILGKHMLNRASRFMTDNQYISRVTGASPKSSLILDDIDKAALAGALHGTSLDVIDDVAYQSSKGKRKAAAASALNPINVAGKALKAMGEIVNLSEEVTRAAIFNRAKKAGMTPEEAAYYTVSSIDFTRGGSLGKIMNAAIPYLNAAVQGSSGYINSFKENKVAFAIKTLEIISASAALTMLRLNTDENNEKWHNPTSIYTRWLLPLFPGQTVKQGNKFEGVSFGIPSSQEAYGPIALGAYLAYRAYAQQTGRDYSDRFDIGTVLKSWFKQFPIETVVSGSAPIPNALATYFGNYDTFRGEKIWKKAEAGAYENNNANPYLAGVLAHLDRATDGKISISPDRLQRAIGKIFSENNTFFKTAGVAADIINGDSEDKDKYSDTLTALKNAPITGRFMVRTNQAGIEEEQKLEQQSKNIRKQAMEDYFGLDDTGISDVEPNEYIPTEELPEVSLEELQVME